MNCGIAESFSFMEMVGDDGPLVGTLCPYGSRKM